ncbi:MAG: arginine--tRNA ligase [Firmicutes bacterium]|nr:arginine--tRNA ligase [Bacillota bacterium]
MIVEEQIREILLKAIEKTGDFKTSEIPLIIDIPREKKFGDYSTNFALLSAKALKKNPREISGKIIEKISDPSGIINDIKIEGGGFINFFVKKEAFHQLIPLILSSPHDYGKQNLGQGIKLQIEFVSANPVGPMHAGHGRWAVLGDSIANILSFTGYDVQREFYVNDFGNQMELFSQSVLARYLELLGESSEFPEEGYKGAYITEIAQKIIDKEGPKFLKMPQDERLEQIRELSYNQVLDLIKKVLKETDVNFDCFFSERTLHASGEVQKTLEILTQNGCTYEQDGAIWLKSSALGDEKDWVLVKSDGNPTYFLVDIAYHKNKAMRGFQKVINIWGSDHFSHVKRMHASLRALGLNSGILEVIIGQMVILKRGGMLVRMSKRTGEMVTLEELIAEVGRDAARFFFIMKSANSVLDFDIELAKSQSQENPVYYLQYAHARICSIFKIAEQEGIRLKEISNTDLTLLAEEPENIILKKMEQFPSVVKNASNRREPHLLAHYALDLAGDFHSYYSHYRILSDGKNLTLARLELLKALKIIFETSCALLGITAPEKM